MQIKLDLLQSNIQINVGTLTTYTDLLEYLIYLIITELLNKYLFITQDSMQIVLSEVGRLRIMLPG